MKREEAGAIIILTLPKDFLASDLREIESTLEPVKHLLKDIKITQVKNEENTRSNISE